MSKCGCFIETIYDTYFGDQRPATEIPKHDRIHYCALHAAAPQLAEHLVMLSGAAEAYMRYHAEKFYAESDVTPTGLWPQIGAAQVLVAEIGENGGKSGCAS